MNLSNLLNPPSVKRDFFVGLLNKTAKDYVANVKIITTSSFIKSIKDVATKSDINRNWLIGGRTLFSKKLNLYTIVLNPNVLGYSELVSTLFHEIGHIMLNHIKVRESKKLKLSEFRKQEISANVWAHSELIKRDDIFSKKQRRHLDGYFDAKITMIEVGSKKALLDTGIVETDKIIKALGLKKRT